MPCSPFGANGGGPSGGVGWAEVPMAITGTPMTVPCVTTPSCNDARALTILLRSCIVRASVTTNNRHVTTFEIVANIRSATISCSISLDTPREPPTKTRTIKTTQTPSPTAEQTKQQSLRSRTPHQKPQHIAQSTMQWTATPSMTHVPTDARMRSRPCSTSSTPTAAKSSSKSASSSGSPRCQYRQVEWEPSAHCQYPVVYRDKPTQQGPNSPHKSSTIWLDSGPGRQAKWPWKPSHARSAAIHVFSWSKAFKHLMSPRPP
mmetsp:Transcript_58188/g.177330  ORF Transcript_58188/g.177330 Transcript_58188/m.177330 type:complete len:261 (-) Transcript_58188:277-1059(-)